MTPASSQTAEVLARVDESLAFDHAFGEPRSILARVASAYDFLAEALSDFAPSVDAFLAELRALGPAHSTRILLDPVIRTALDSSLFALRQGAESIPPYDEEILLAATQFAGVASESSPLASEMRQLLLIGLGEPPHTTLVWAGRSPSGKFGARFEALVQAEIVSSHLPSSGRLLPAGRREQETLQRALDLLDHVLPATVRSMLPHLMVVGLLEPPGKRAGMASVESLSFETIPGSVFLATEPLATTWKAAEVLLHEMVHQKLTDFTLTRSIFRLGYTAESSPRIHVEWNEPSEWNPNAWPVDRAEAAFHVYAHLAAFYWALADATLHQRLPATWLAGLDPRSEAERTLRRATHLGSELLRVGTEALGPDGIRLVVWLRSVLSQLDDGLTSPA